MGPGANAAKNQAEDVKALGGRAIIATGDLINLNGISGVIFWGNLTQKRDIAQALAARTGAILPLLTGLPNAGYVLEEQHLCVDITAAGGNAALLAKSAPDT